MFVFNIWQTHALTFKRDSYHRKFIIEIWNAGKNFSSISQILLIYREYVEKRKSLNSIGKVATEGWWSFFQQEPNQWVKNNF